MTAVAGPEPVALETAAPTFEFAQGMSERVARLKTMGFAKGEIKPILEAEFKEELSDEAFDALFHQMQLGLAKMPEVQDLKLSLGETWKRHENLLEDLLNLYQLLVRHFNAYMTGKTELDDGTPVRMVKAKDLMGVIQMITKLGQENVTSKMNAVRLLPDLEVPQLEKARDPKALMQDFIDDAIYDAEFDDLDQDDLDDPEGDGD